MNEIQARCRGCSKAIVVQQRDLDQEIRCDTCGGSIPVPGTTPSPKKSFLDRLSGEQLADIGLNLAGFLWRSAVTVGVAFLLLDRGTEIAVLAGVVVHILFGIRQRLTEIKEKLPAFPKPA